MRLFKLLKKANYLIDNNIIDHKIEKLVDNSKEACNNCIFFAIAGSKFFGIDFVDEAIEKGAKTIVYTSGLIEKKEGINYIQVDDTKKALALFAKFFYHNITKKIKLIGITGTNGKTSVSTIIMDYLAFSGYNPLLIGTNGIFFEDQHFLIENTTPSLLKIYDTIQMAKKKGADYVIMEVSSIGIRERRVMYLDFDIVILTNVSHDHLDYHKNITDYKYSKGLLFANLSLGKNKYAILNKDDDSYELFNSITKGNVISFGIKNCANYQAIDISKKINGTTFIINYKDKAIDIKTSLIGGFNVYNILAAFACIDALNLDVLSFSDFAKIYVPISGRMNRIYFKSRTIYIDFAHTPSSVENVLISIKECSNCKLTVIVGCGGNRDKSKRAIIGQIVSKYADKIIFTSDNPRNENEIDIIKDMSSNISKDSYKVIVDRKEAIETALRESIKDEKIAILGKGCERDQIINGIKHPFSDKAVVFNWIKKMNNKL